MSIVARTAVTVMVTVSEIIRSVIGYSPDTEGWWIKCNTDTEPYGVPIPAFPERIGEIRLDRSVRFILVVEKETLFARYLIFSFLVHDEEPTRLAFKVHAVSVPAGFWVEILSSGKSDSGARKCLARSVHDVTVCGA